VIGVAGVLAFFGELALREFEYGSRWAPSRAGFWLSANRPARGLQRLALR